MKHLSGLGAIIRECGIKNLKSAASRKLFHEYRCMDVRIPTSEQLLGTMFITCYRNLTRP